MGKTSPTIEIFYFAGCPNHEPTLKLTHEVLGDLELDSEVLEVAVETLADAETQRFVGSPSVRVNGRDIEPEVEDRTDFGLGCRIYGTGGVPPRELLIEALREAL